ncbi:MAG: hydratase, partial [Treponema sp.]|nr:hydratase [Treponema sp.]
MIELYQTGVWLLRGSEIIRDDEEGRAKLKNLGGGPGKPLSPEEGRKGTMAWGILSAHNSGDEKNLRIKFDSLTSHDITYVGIIQTARASGMDKFPVPYVLTNCHNSLCAVGGTINEDDHKFAL